MIKDYMRVLKCDVDPDKAYQVRIKTGIRSKHFIMCAVKNNMLHIYDTWDSNLIDVPIFNKPHVFMEIDGGIIKFLQIGPPDNRFRGEIILGMGRFKKHERKKGTGGIAVFDAFQ